jgi:hypothetical protein
MNYSFIKCTYLFTVRQHITRKFMYNAFIQLIKFIYQINSLINYVVSSLIIITTVYVINVRVIIDISNQYLVRVFTN